MVLLYSGSMSNVSLDILEAADIDGASDFVKLIHIILPSIFPTITTFLVASIANIFIDQAQLFTFFATNVKPSSSTIGYYIFIQIASNSKNYSSYPFAATLGLAFTLIAVPLTLTVKFLMEKFGPSED